MPLLPLALGWLLLAPTAVSARADGEPAEYLVEAAAHSESVFLLPAGPRTLTVLEIEPAGGTAEAWRSARLRLSWKGGPGGGSNGAAVSLPVGLLFGRFDAGAGVGPSSRLDSSGPSWSLRALMPYDGEAYLRLDTDQPLQGRLRLRTRRGTEKTFGYFHAVDLGHPVIPPQAVGRGRLIGVLAAGPGAGAPPVARDLGTLAVDGKPAAKVTELFGLPWPPGGPPRDDRGAPQPRPGGPWAAYRWFTDDDAPRFDRGAVAGDRPSATTKVVLFWYSDQPEAGTIPLP